MAGFNFSSGVMVFAVKPARQGERWTSPRIYTDSSVKMWVKPTPDSTNTAGSAIEKDAAGWPRPYMPVCIWHYWCLCVLLFMWGLCSAQTPSSPVNHRKRKKPLLAQLSLVTQYMSAGVQSAPLVDGRNIMGNSQWQIYSNFSFFGLHF